MTDEEYGRAWANMTGHAPQRFISLEIDGDKPVWDWFHERWCRSVDGRAVVSLYVWREMEGGRSYPSESAAYAALGRAVREVHRLVPPLPT